MILTFWHEPAEVSAGTAPTWFPNRTGSKRPLGNQDSWKEKPNGKLLSEEGKRVGKKFKIAWDDDVHQCRVVCYHPEAKKYKVFSFFTFY